MVTNAKFQIDIYGNTAQFENSLKGVNTALTALRGEASGLRKALQLDPGNTTLIAQLQKNLTQQLEQSRSKANQLRNELKSVDSTDPDSQKKFLSLTRQINNADIQAAGLEKELKSVSAQLINGKYEAKAELDVSGVNKAVENVKSRFSALREIAVGAFRQIGSSIASAVGNQFKEAVSGALDTQKALVGLKSSLKLNGADKDYQKLSSSLQTLAADTNANADQTIKLATTFVGLGDSSDSAYTKVANLVKANQNLGGSSQSLEGVALAYGQISASGKVGAENINQLTDNNTALGASLKKTVLELNPSLKQYGSFAKAAEEGAVTVDMLDKALQQVANNTAAGGVTLIGDAFSSFQETLSNQLIPVLDAVTPAIDSVFEALTKIGSVAIDGLAGFVQYLTLLYYQLQGNGAIEDFRGIINNLGVSFRLILGIIGKVITQITGIDGAAVKSGTSTESLAGIIKSLSESILTATARFDIFLNSVSNNKKAIELLSVAVIALSTAFAAFKISSAILTVAKVIGGIISAIQVLGGLLPAIGTLLAGLSLPITAIVAAIAAVTAGLVYFFTQTETGKKIITDLVNSFSNGFSGIGKTIDDLKNNIVSKFNEITTGVSNTFNGVLANIQNAFNGIVEFFTGIVASITTAFQSLGLFFTTLWTTISTNVITVWTNITTFLGTVIQSIISIFQPLISFYQALFGLIANIINLFVQVVLAALRGLALLIQNIFSSVGQFINGIWQNVSNFISGVVNYIEGLFQKLGNFISSVWQSIINYLNPIIQQIQNAFATAFSFIVGVWGTITGFFSGVWSSIRNLASAAWSAISSFASSARNFVISVWSSISGFFSNIFSSISRTVSNVFGAVTKFASNAVQNIYNVFNGIVGFFSDIFGTVRDIIDGALGGVTSTINGISRTIGGLADKVSGLFRGSSISEALDVNLASSGMLMNSITAGSTNTTNTFNIQAGQMDTTTLARAIRREFNTGRA